MILVTGATGTVGRALVDRLITAGHSVRATTRKPDAAVLPEQVEVVAADLGDAGAAREVMTGIEQVFLLSSGPDMALHDTHVASAAHDGGAHRIVKLSIISAGYDDARDPITRWHQQGERAVRASGLSWTLLRPTAFMSNALNWADTIADHNTAYAPYGRGSTAVIDPDDIAAAAATVLTSPADHEGCVYTLTGPAALSPEQQIATLSTVLDRPLTYREIPPEAARAAMLDSGLPVDVADGVLALLASGVDPRSAVVDPAVEQILGRPATPFAHWARCHRAAFVRAA